MNVLNLIKDRIESKLHVDFNLLKYSDPVHLVEDDGELTQSSTSKMFKHKDSTIWDLLEDDTMRLAYGIIGESTGRGFERIRSKYNKIQPDKPLPSSYYLNKQLPVSIVPFEHKHTTKSSSSVLPNDVKNKILYGFFIFITQNVSLLCMNSCIT